MEALRIFLFSFTEGPDAAINADFALHIFKLIKKFLALYLFFFVLCSNCVQVDGSLFQRLLVVCNFFFELGSVGCLSTELFYFLFEDRVFLESILKTSFNFYMLLLFAFVGGLKFADLLLELLDSFLLFLFICLEIGLLTLQLLLIFNNFVCILLLTRSQEFSYLVLELFNCFLQLLNFCFTCYIHLGKFLLDLSELLLVKLLLSFLLLLELFDLLLFFAELLAELINQFVQYYRVCIPLLWVWCVASGSCFDVLYFFQAQFILKLFYSLLQLFFVLVVCLLYLFSYFLHVLL